MTLSVGDTVRNKPELGHLWAGTGWYEKMQRPRIGTVARVPDALRREGSGTVLVEWKSLTGPETWTMWTHTDLIEKADQ